MTSSLTAVSCPLCYNQFSHVRATSALKMEVFGYGLDFRSVPRDCNRSADIAICPDCFFTARVQDLDQKVPGHVRELVRSKGYLKILKSDSDEEFLARGWLALISVLTAKGVNPRDLGLLSLKGSWVARELGCLETEQELLQSADAALDEALRRGLTKGDPGMVMYLLGEINRRRGEFLRGREMLTFLGNNPRYRYPALLLTVLVEEEDTTPYWSLYSPDQMEQYSPRFKGLFPALRSVPPRKTEFSPDELSDQDHVEQSDEDDGRLT
ncbi:MAG: DUF2225 domain-containing protein [Desulfomonile tiedjei]|nr:DUF2225 domain-containing protein [Desulfomonile tiedjei]